MGCKTKVHVADILRNSTQPPGFKKRTHDGEPMSRFRLLQSPFKHEHSFFNIAVFRRGCVTIADAGRQDVAFGRNFLRRRGPLDMCHRHQRLQPEFSVEDRAHRLQSIALSL